MASDSVVLHELQGVEAEPVKALPTLWEFEYDGWENISYLFENYLGAFEDDAMWNAVRFTSNSLLASFCFTFALALALALLLAPGGRFRFTERGPC
ncbi:MAG: hypothetical protein CM1200mP30_22370 [Pseudomonadota bacterium]|nr:MAG: hypothetical protein CM1200mP30_22370 [Pseudomonadota bacterium]